MRQILRHQEYHRLGRRPQFFLHFAVQSSALPETGPSCTTVNKSNVNPGSIIDGIYSDAVVMNNSFRTDIWTPPNSALF